VSTTFPDASASAPAPDRGERPEGRWSTPGLLDEVLRLAVLERATAHLVAGWAAKVPELDDKLAVAAAMEGNLTRAIALRNHALALLERDADRLVADPALIRPLVMLDVDGDPEAVVRAVRSEAPEFLASRYRALASRLDPLFDARLGATVGAAVEALAWSASVGGSRLFDALDAAWREAGARNRVHLDAILWAPVDRVPFPARPAGRMRPLPGARGHFRSVSRRTDEDLAGELNDNVMAELSAMELLSRSSYEHPDEAWSFHLALARHAADEQRHAAIFRRLLAQRGLDESSLVVHAANYEWAYEFPECAVGSKRELLWRLLLMCTVLEGLAVDKLPIEIATRDWLDQPDFARALDYIATDELFHTENGLRLTRELCQRHEFDSMLERERVHGRFFGRQRDARAAYLAEDAERAAREIAIMEGPDPDLMPFTSRTEVALRQRCGYTYDECLQVDRWGYNIPLPD
jgi:uncharacterized ferritin-like protein (DUF455 family)